MGSDTLLPAVSSNYPDMGDKEWINYQQFCSLLA